MAMSAASLKNRMKANMDAIYNDYLNGEKSNDDAMVALAQAIIDEITINSEVKITSGSSAGVYKVE